MNEQGLSSVENQQQHNSQENPEWVCSCGRVNRNQYCCDCGSPRPVQQQNQTEQPTPNNNHATRPQPKEKMSKLKLFLIILAFIATFGSQALMYTTFFGGLSASLQQVIDEEYGNMPNSNYGNNDLFGDLLEDEADEIASNNEQFREYFHFDDLNSEAISENELSSIASEFYASQSKNGADYSPGIYTVGKDINSGRYLIYGNQKEISTFFILTKHEDGSSYNVVIVNTYYGNNQINLTDGDIIVCDSEKGFCSKDDFTSSYSSPYKSGVYEVGKDIPAGTYTLTAGEANDYSAYYIMKDLNYTNESVTDSKTAILGNGKMEVKLEEGTFVEFYNIKAKSGSASSAAFA